MKTSLLALQDALYFRLRDDENLKQRITGVYDSVSEGAAYPYIVLGDDTVNEWSTKLTYGEEVTSTLHVYSDYDGKSEVKEILNLILKSLSEPLSLDDGFFVEYSRMDFLETLTEENGTIKHGILRLRYKISQENEE